MANRYWVAGSANWNSTSSWSATSGGASGASVPTSSDDVFFDRSATYTASIPGVVVSCKSLNISAGTVTIALGSTTASKLNINGDINFTGSNPGTSITGSAGTVGISISPSSSITMAGRSLGSMPIDLNGSLGGVFTFNDAFTCTGTLSLTRGTMVIGNNTVTCSAFLSTAGNTRSFDFGTSGSMVITGTGTSFNIVSSTGNPTYSGNPIYIFTYSGGTAMSASGFTPGSWYFTAGTYALTHTPSLSWGFVNLIFTGFSGSWTRGTTTQAMPCYGSLTLSSTMASPTAVGSGAFQFVGTSGTQVITSGGKTIDAPIQINTAGSTVQLADALTVGATRTLQILGGTFDGNGKTISGSSGFSASTGPSIITGISTTLTFTHTSGNITQSGPNTFGAYSLTAGTLNLSSYTLTAGTFASSNSNTRTIAFGTGSMTLTGSGVSIWNTFTTTNLTTTGSQTVNLTYSGATASTIAPGPLSEANAVSFNVTAGSYALTSISASNNFRSLNFQGFTGTAPATGTSSIVYGDITLGSTITSFGTTGTTINLGSTSTQTITTSGKTFGCKIIQNGVGGTVRLADALTQLSTVDFALVNGTLDLNGKTLTVGAVTNGFATYLTGTKNITFNGGTLVCPFSGQAFNNPSPTGFTTTAGTGTGKISFTAAASKTFAANGSTYNCTVSNDGAGALTISGANTIDTVTTTSGNVLLTGSNTLNTITTAIRPVTFTFTSGTTQTINNWNLSGTLGNLVTVVSGTLGSAATVSKSSGVVSADYLSLRDSAATGGATWYAGANSLNVSGNSGWIFTGPPAGNNGAFFFMF